MFQEVYDVFGDGTNLSNLVSNLHIVNDIAPQLGGNLDMNGYIINGNGSINITSSITTGNNLVAVGAVLSFYFPNKFMMTDEFKAHSLLWKILYSLGGLKAMMYRTYVVGWCLMEVGPLASGLSYNGLDDKG
jgi:hypothetical protein